MKKLFLYDISCSLQTRILVILTLLTFAQSKKYCGISRYYDKEKDQCLGCDSTCSQCAAITGQCLLCKDPSMTLNPGKTGCRCPNGFQFSPDLDSCMEMIGGRLRFEFSSLDQEKRMLSTALTPIVIQGQNLSVSNTDFVASLASGQYMITVDHANYTTGLSAIFTNCSFDISGGGVLYTDLPIQISFINCTFNVSQTQNTLVLDYSTNGCTPSDMQGNLLIQDSLFQDGSTPPTSASTGFSLFNITSLYNLTLQNVVFANLTGGYQSLFQDMPCNGTQLTSPQLVQLDSLSFFYSNIEWAFNYSNQANASSQLMFQLMNSQFFDLNMSAALINLTQSSYSPQLVTLSNNTFGSLKLSYPLISLALNGSSAVAQQITISNSLMHQFMSVASAASLTVSSVTFSNITNYLYGDETIGLIQGSIVAGLMALDSVQILNSSLIYSPAVIANSVSDLSFTNLNVFNVSLSTGDLFVLKQIEAFSANNVSVNEATIQNSQSTISIFYLDTVNLVQNLSAYSISNITFENSQTLIFRMNNYELANSADTSKYQFTLENCTFSGNTYTNFELYMFENIPTTEFDLVDVNCIPSSAMPSCASSQYYDTVLNQCNSCPTGCSACLNESLCTSCQNSTMSIDPTSGMCECPYQQYFYDAVSPMCMSNLTRSHFPLDCLSKCATCNTNFECITYAACPNQYQTLINGQCYFTCQAGAQVTASTCTNCTIANCTLCDLSSGSERCAKCAPGSYLDLSSYTCVSSCPAASKQIASSNVYNHTSETIGYCRPFVAGFNFTYQYWINPNSSSQFELGTPEFPFKNMDSPAKEIFNFMYDLETNFTVFHARGTTYKLYYGIMPIIILNLQMYHLVDYGDPSLPKPYVYITDIPYQWPDSTLFSIAETYYNLSYRISKGDISSSEASQFFLKFNIFRASQYIQNIDFQSIMFGDAWSNPLVFSFDAQNKSATFENCYFDLDGALHEGYYPFSSHTMNCHINVTNYQYGIWLDYRWDCYAYNATQDVAKVTINGTLFTGQYQQALYNFIYVSTMDNFLLNNNTFDGVTWLDMATRPFLDVHPQSLCDPPDRTQLVQLNENKFLNLANSNLIFAVNYMNPFNGTKIFSMQNNFYNNSVINTQFIQMQIYNPSPVTVGNNVYQNISVLPGETVFYFFSEASNISISNETVVGNTLDDLYTIGAANSIFIQDFIVAENVNTGSITETSAVLSIAQANGMAQIQNFKVTNSTFMYGMAVNIQSAQQLDFKDSEYANVTLENNDFFTFNQIISGQIHNLQFQNFTKQSDKSRYAISIPTLTLSQQANSSYLLNNITYIGSQSSFLSVAQVSLKDGQNSTFGLNITDCIIQNNTLSSKDDLIDFGQINFMNFLVTLSNVSMQNNSLQLGTMFGLQMNCRQMLIQDSLILNNQGQFAYLSPASSDTSNPLQFYIDNTQFLNNFAGQDALIQLTTNSMMFTTNSVFQENYSIGRGSVVFADYQAVYALFQNCTIHQNYAYQGGVFYIQYSSLVEAANCSLSENFAVTGGVAYVNNDGKIKLNNRTQVYNNSALNTCFLFLINSQYESSIDNITVTQNDQTNPVIQKSIFLQQNDTYKFIQKGFFDAMQLISNKVQRTINEQADSSVYAIKAKINFTNTLITDNDDFLSASTQSIVGLQSSQLINILATGTMIQAVSSSIEFIDVLMGNITYSIQPGTSNFYKVSIVNQSFLRLSSSTMSNITGLLLYVSGSQFIMDNGTHTVNVTNDDTQNPTIQIDTSTIEFNQSTFDQLHSNYYSPIINLQSNTLTASDTVFTNFDKTLFSCQSGDYYFQNLSVHSGGMTWMPGQRVYMVNSIVFDVSGANLTLNQTNISGIFTNFSSPVVYIQNDASATSKILLEIENSTFTNNLATDQAGVVYALNTDVNVDSSVFLGNQALTSDGGVFYLDCQAAVSYTCNYTIQNSVFTNNSAFINGGAIKFTYYKPDITTNNTFTSNTAQYGPIMASYPAQMIIDSQQSHRRRNLQILNATQTAALNITNGIVFNMVSPLQSGSLMSESVVLELIDEIGRLITTDNSSTAVMGSISASVQVMKSKSVTSMEGMFTFNDVIVIGPPGNSILLTIACDSINPSMIANAFPNITQEQIYVLAYLRLCDRGEYQTSDNKCIQCSDGFFTLQPNQTQCKECPENAVCQNGYEIVVDSGYWREDVNSTSIYVCYNPSACPGGYETTCATGYGGNLCQSCVEVNGTWYSRSGSNGCTECISYSLNAWRLVGVTILIVAYFVVLIWIDIKTAGQKKNTTVYMRILTNYFQILTLAQSYNLSWDANMMKFLEAMSIIAQSTQMILSIDCFVRDNGVTTNPAFVKMILACMFPLICIGASLVFWIIFKAFRQKSSAMTNLIKSVIVIIFISLPTITTITFAIYNCVNIFNNGSTYLALDMSIQCWTGAHSHYAESYGIPIVIIWVVGFPLLALGILFSKRKSLNEQQTLVRYGFLYTGLNHNAFYWEILLHFRKVLLICINVFFTTFQSIYRALVGFMLMIIYIEILQKIQPYQTKEINELEFKANIAAFATFYGGLFFISSDLPMGVSGALFVFIMIINFVFWFAWFKLTFQSLYERMHTFLSRYISCLKKKTKPTDIDQQVEVQYEAGPQLSNHDFDDEKPRKGKGLDDSSRYALADVQSNRNVQDESYRMGASAYIINGAKNISRQGTSTKVAKGKEVTSSGEIDESSSVPQKKLSKQRQARKLKKVQADNEDSVSNSDDEKPTQKGNRKKSSKKQSSGDSHLKNGKSSTSDQNDKATAAQILENRTSNDQDEEASQRKVKKQEKKKKKRTKVVQNEDIYQSVDQSMSLDQSMVADDQELRDLRSKREAAIKSYQARRTKHISKVGADDDDADDTGEYEAPFQKPKKRKETGIRAFSTGKRLNSPGNNYEDDSERYNDQKAKVHTVKYKGQVSSIPPNKRGRNNDGKLMAQTQKEKERMFEQRRRIIEMSMRPVNKSSSETEDAEDARQRKDSRKKANAWLQRDQPHQSRSKSRNKKHKEDLESEDQAAQTVKAKKSKKKSLTRNILQDSSFSDFAPQSKKQYSRKRKGKIVEATDD